MAAQVGANPAQQIPAQQQQPAANENPAPKTLFTQVKDGANLVWNYSAQKMTDLKSGVLGLVVKVMAAVSKFIKMVGGWCGCSKPAPAEQAVAQAEPQQVVEPLQAPPQQEAQAVAPQEQAPPVAPPVTNGTTPAEAENPPEKATRWFPFW